MGQESFMGSALSVLFIPACFSTHTNHHDATIDDIVDIACAPIRTDSSDICRRWQMCSTRVRTGKPSDHSCGVASRIWGNECEDALRR